MENLLMLEANEFFMDDSPIRFLGPIKPINLFIGANNTRKSRLLRNIISSKNKLVVNSMSSLNRLILEGTKLADNLFDPEKLEPLTSLLSYEGNTHYQIKPGRFSEVRNFFDNQPEQNITISLLQRYLKTIVNNLTTGVTSDNKPLPELIIRFHDILDMLVYIYELAFERSGILPPVSRHVWEEHNMNLLRFKIPDRNVGGSTSKLAEKMELCKAIRGYTAKLLSVSFEKISPASIYIPTLRSSRNLLNDNHELAGREIFKYTVNYQYFGERNAPNNITVHTGQEHFDLFDRAKRGLTPERNNFREFERFIGRSFYQSENLEIISHPGGRNPDILISLPGEKEDVPIHHLGDGVQAVINLFFPIFTAENGAWIFIEEPELNLHPGFQNLFIRTLIENEFLKEKGLKYFINTHSNHVLSEILLNNEALSEVFVLHKRDADSSDIISFSGFEHATLELLGVLNTSTLISNCSVWVEGVTDRLYIRAFLSAFLKTINGFEPIEGLNYSFIEYGGKNLIHYLFNEQEEQEKDPGIKAFFISTKIFLLADTDSGKDATHESYKKLASKRFHYEHTGYPEIENILPAELLKKYLQEKLRISKEHTEIIFSTSHYKTKLGKFLGDKFTKLGIETKISAKTGGTLSPYYKSGLAEYTYQEVISGNISWEMLSTSAPIKRIIESLYSFISKNNK